MNAYITETQIIHILPISNFLKYTEQDLINNENPYEYMTTTAVVLYLGTSPHMGIQAF